MDAGLLLSPDEYSSAAKEVVQSHAVQIRRCYERAAKAGTQDDRVEGRIEAEFAIQPSGEVTDVRVVDNDTGSQQLGECLAALIRSWRFPSPGRDAVEFAWPFVFRQPR